MKRGGPLKRTAMRRKPPRRGVMDPAFRERVMRRDNWTCQAKVIGFAPEVVCSGDLHAHHRTLGTKVDEDWNVVAVCGAHHRHLHDVDRAGAEEVGLILRRGAGNVYRPGAV